MTMPGKVRAILIASLTGLCLAVPAALADEAETVAAAEAGATLSSDVYAPLNQLLQNFGRADDGRLEIAYAAIDDRVQRALSQYIDYLGTVPVSALTQQDQLAFWLNTRNTLIIQAMADSRNRRRMSAHRGTFAEPGPMWTQDRISVGGEDLSIDEIERAILANFPDTPNLIYGLYQGTRGGASLPERAFEASTLDTQLETLGHDFVNSRQGVKVRRGSLQLPAIYSWYSAPLFAGDDAALRAHIAGLADTDLAVRLADAEGTKLRKFSYASDELIIRQQVNTGGAGFGNSGGSAGGGSFGS